ncbi:hypothetical protein Q8A73_014804 [Channa argus]|nr:hypothetical protein Q8A73_014804 [Channa argus]
MLERWKSRGGLTVIGVSTGAGQAERCPLSGPLIDLLRTDASQVSPVSATWRAEPCDRKCEITCHSIVPTEEASARQLQAHSVSLRRQLLQLLQTEGTWVINTPPGTELKLEAAGDPVSVITNHKSARFNAAARCCWRCCIPAAQSFHPR